jgi:hypothetical protein
VWTVEHVLSQAAIFAPLLRKLWNGAYICTSRSCFQAVSPG